MRDQHANKRLVPKNSENECVTKHKISMLKMIKDTHFSSYGLNRCCCPGLASKEGWMGRSVSGGDIKKTQFIIAEAGL